MWGSPRPAALLSGGWPHQERRLASSDVQLTLNVGLPSRGSPTPNAGVQFTVVCMLQARKLGSPAAMPGVHASVRGAPNGMVAGGLIGTGLPGGGGAGGASAPTAERRIVPQ